MIHIWDIKLKPEQLDKLSIADLLALEKYAHERGDGKHNNYKTIAMAIERALIRLSF